MNKKLYHGAVWYPELWSSHVLDQDLQLMKQAGINAVRIGEFAWSVFEPEEGKADISTFAAFIRMLHQHGIDTVMCTPTVTPPVWLTHNHPERLFVNRQGQALGHGSRQHICTNNPYFRERAAFIIEKIAEALSGEPGLIAWQLDNEFKSHVAECYCGTCRKLWHEWLEHRYGTIEALNEAWGTAVWSETYYSFRQVPQPGATPFIHNTSLSTMYQLFSMEKIAEFALMQADIIRRYSEAPITHNSSIAFHLDNEQLFAGLDFASYDTYASRANVSAYLINCDLYRNYKPGRGFWVMETSTSHSGSVENLPQVHPYGYVQAEAVAAYALGATGFCYWPWRQQRAGSEQTHGAVISTWGAPTIGYRNVQEVEAARRVIEPLFLATRPMQAEVAITYSDRAKAFLRTETHKTLQHRGLVSGFYERILWLGIHRDEVPEGGSLAGYKLLFTPFLPYVSSAYMQQALQFVENGGIWVAGPLTGGRTEEHTFHTDAALSLLEHAAGVRTAFTYPMDGTGSTGTAFGVNAPLSLWSSVFEPVEAAAIGLIEGGLSPGLSFLTEYKRGKGKLVMLGSMPEGPDGEEMLRRMIAHYASEAAVTLCTDTTKGTIVAPRQGEGFVLWVIVNMDGNGGQITLPPAGIDGITGAAVPAGKLEVGAYEYRLIRFEE